MRVADLPLAAPATERAPEPAPAQAAEKAPAAPAAPTVTQAPPPPKVAVGAASAYDIFAMIERLAELRRKDILTEEEFVAKKAELLGRI